MPPEKDTGGLRKQDLEALHEHEIREDEWRHRARVERGFLDQARIRDFLQQPLNMIRLAAAGLGVLGLFLLAQSLNVQGATPSGASASPAPGVSGSPAASGAPVTGTTTANATFTKVSGPCRLATRFTDRFSIEAKSGALTLTQLSNGHVSRGTIDPNGAFTTSAEGQGYRGTITGTTATGQHTYTGGGCNEVYDFTMSLSSPLIATSGTAPRNRPPVAGPIVAVQEGTSTIYTVPDASDPEGAPLRWSWTNTNPCAPRTGTGATYTWPHPHPPCPAEPVHPATITVTISDGGLAVIREYAGGSAAGTGQVPPTPSAAATTSAPTSAPSPTAAPATGGTFSFPLFALGLIFLIGALGLLWGGPRLIGGPLIAQQKEPETDPCAREKAREAAARARRDAANARLERIDALDAERRRTQEAADRAAAAEAAAKQGASYGEANGVRVYTNKQKGAEIAAAERAAREARAAADRARAAFDAAGGQRELADAQEERYRANRDWQEAYDALQRCLGLFAPPPPPVPPASGGGGGTTTGGTGTGVGTGTGTDDGTRERTCRDGDVKKGSERVTTREFTFAEIHRAQIVLDAVYPGAQYVPIYEFIEWMEFVRNAFKAGKAIKGLAGGELVEGTLDTIDYSGIADIPDFLTFWDKLTEAAMRGLRQTGTIFIDRFGKLGDYSLRFTRRTYTATCRTWEQCEGGAWVAKKEFTFENTRTDHNATAGPISVHDKREIPDAIDRLFRRLESTNTSATNGLRSFEQSCGQ